MGSRTSAWMRWEEDSLPRISRISILFIFQSKFNLLEFTDVPVMLIWESIIGSQSETTGPEQRLACKVGYPKQG